MGVAIQKADMGKKKEKRCRGCDMGDKTEKLNWRCHTPRLFEEILVNEGCAILHQPLRILLGILSEVAERAIELDDAKLHALMIRLTLYSCADPLNEDYDGERVKEVMSKVK